MPQQTIAAEARDEPVHDDEHQERGKEVEEERRRERAEKRDSRSMDRRSCDLWSKSSSRQPLEFIGDGGEGKHFPGADRASATPSPSSRTSARHFTEASPRGAHQRDRAAASRCG